MTKTHNQSRYCESAVYTAIFEHIPQIIFEYLLFLKIYCCAEKEKCHKVVGTNVLMIQKYYILVNREYIRSLQILLWILVCIGKQKFQ